MEIFIRYLHFISILTVFGTLLCENILIGKSLSRREITRLSLIDLAYGLSIMSAVAAGLLLWFKYGKGFDFYFHNPVFLAKLGVVIVIGLLSIYPTVWFLKQRKGAPDEKIDVPGPVSAMVRAELVLIIIVPLLAVLMARGIGLR